MNRNLILLLSCRKECFQHVGVLKCNSFEPCSVTNKFKMSFHIDGFQCIDASSLLLLTTNPVFLLPHQNVQYLSDAASFFYLTIFSYKPLKKAHMHKLFLKVLTATFLSSFKDSAIFLGKLQVKKLYVSIQCLSLYKVPRRC